MKRNIFFCLLLFALMFNFAGRIYAQEQQPAKSESSGGGDEGDDSKEKDPDVPKMESKAGGGGGKEDLVRDGDNNYKSKSLRQMKREERKQRRKYEKLRKKQTRATEKRMKASEGHSNKVNGHSEMPFYKRWFKHSKEAMAPKNNNGEKSAFGRFWYSITHPFSNKKRHNQQRGEFKRN